MVALIAIVVGLVTGWLAGGKLRGIRNIRLRHEVSVVVVFLVQAVARGRLLGTTASTAGMLIWAAVSVALAVLLLMNRQSAGALIAAVGIVLNLDVVLLNVGMPVSTTLTAGVASATAHSGGFYFVAHGGTIAPWLGDALLCGVFGQTALLSVGDVLLAIGVATLVSAAMLEGARPQLGE